MNFVFSQVGINTETPNSNTLLHISEKIDDAVPFVPKGIIIPRLSESERDEMTYENPLAEPKVLKLLASDNSLMIYNTTEDCYNYWNYLEQEWKSLCGDIGNSKFTYNCTDITVYGSYSKENITNASHYILIKVDVTKRGNYTITTTTNPENGYSFVGQGIFTDLGTQEIKLYAQGTPLESGPNTITFNSSGSSTQEECPIIISVQENIANYTLNCSSANVTGSYIKNTALTSLNTIILNVNVSTIGSYNIHTEMVNGIKFQGNGQFTAQGTQQVILYGVGTPTVNDDFDVTVISNSKEGNTTCQAKIFVTLPPMTYAVLGANNSYTWHPSNVRAEAFNSTSFGPNGVVKIQSLTNIWNTTSANVAVTELNKPIKPDIVLFFSYGTTVNTNLAQALSEYVNNGGVLIYGTTDTQFGEANILLNGIFGEQFAQRQVTGNGSVDDNIYKIENLANDPIINGPFGNTADKYWGEDNTSTGSIVVTQLPANSVQIASAFNEFSKTMVDPLHSIVWYNNSKNFVYFGDSVGAANDTSLINYPAYYINGVPKSKRYGQWPNETTQSRFIFNSTLELNAVAWALKKAAVAGINPH